MVSKLTEVTLPRARRSMQYQFAMADQAPTRTKRKAAQPAFARLAVADELGLIKVVQVPAGPAWGSAAIVQTWGQPSKDDAIHAIAAPHFLTSPYDDVLAVSRRHGKGQLLSSVGGHVLAPLPLLPASDKKAARASSSQQQQEVKCLQFWQQPDQPLRLVSCGTNGMLSVLIGPAEQLQGEGVQGTAWATTTAMQTAPNVECMALAPSVGSVAVGGDGCQLQVWNMNTSQEVFKAKGGKPNKVGNVDLPHLTAVTFLPGDPVDNLVLVGTVKHKLWLYDVRAGKRPQMDLAWGESRITGLAAEPDGKRVWVANGVGQVEALDLKGQRMQGSMKGAAGSVRSLTLHPDASQPLMASVSLDRFMRVHDTGTRVAVGKVYCKQQLAAVTWLKPLPVIEESHGEGEGKVDESVKACAGGGDENGSKNGSTHNPEKKKKKIKS